MCLYKHREDVYLEIWCRLNGSEALSSLFHETLTVIILFTQQLNCIPAKYRCVYCTYQDYEQMFACFSLLSTPCVFKPTVSCLYEQCECFNQTFDFCPKFEPFLCI